MYQIIIRHLWRVREYDVVRAYSLSGGVGRQIGFSAGYFIHATSRNFMP